MNILNDLLKLRKQYPNNNDFAEAMDIYLKNKNLCCQDPKNHIRREIVDEGPYGYYGYEITCKKCGETIECKID